MQSALAIAIVGMGATASAIIPPRIYPRDGPGSSDAFTLHAYGKANGPIGQLYDGQNRIGGGLPLGYYTIKYGPKGGAIVDKNGRGCIITPPTTQFQCDEGVGGTPGFDISCEKKLLYNGSSEFWACPVDDYGVWNLYTKPNFGQKKCITITLRVHGDSPSQASCKQSKPALPATAPPAPFPPAPAPPAPSSYAPAPPAPSSYASAPPASSSYAPSPPAPSSYAPSPPAPSPPCKHCNEYPCDCKPAPKTDNKNKLSPDGSCGGKTGFHCNGYVAGSCCSSHGWCGSKPTHCEEGCQVEFGTCAAHKNNSKPAAPSVPPRPTPPQPTLCNDEQCPPVPSPTCSGGKHDDKCKPSPSPSPPAEETIGCPADLKGPYEFPHLIVPVDKSSPNKAYGTKLNGTFSDDICSIFNFDIDSHFTGKTCSLTFLFPKQEHLETSSYTFETWDKPAGLQFYAMKKPATLNTTWNNAGEKELLAEGPVYPDLAVGAYNHKCPGGKTEAIMVCGKDVILNYFQDFNPSPIGMYMRVC